MSVDEISPSLRFSARKWNLSGHLKSGHAWSVQNRPTGDDNDLVVKGIVDIGQSLIGAGRGLIYLSRALHAQSFVRTLVMEDFDEVVEAF